MSLFVAVVRERIQLGATDELACGADDFSMPMPVSDVSCTSASFVFSAKKTDNRLLR
jgi:hypothetical protein